MRRHRCWGLGGWLLVGALGGLSVVGCQTASRQQRDVAADEALTDNSTPHPSTPVTAPAQPQPGFQQEPPKSQTP